MNRGHVFAIWPWERCKAVYVRGNRVRRCDLKKGHSSPHISDQGFERLSWEEQVVYA